MSHSVGSSWGVGAAHCLGQLALGVAQQQGPAFLLVSMPETRKIVIALGEGRAVEAQWLRSLRPNLPIETASLTLEVSPSQVSGIYLNSNHSQICHPVAEEMAGFKHFFLQGPEFSFAHPGERHRAHQRSEGSGALAYPLPERGMNHSLHVGKSAVQLSELKKATPVAGRLSAPTFKIDGQATPRQAGIFYR